MMIRKSKTAALGIDINERTISAVELRAKKGSLAIRRAGTVPMPDGAMSRGVVTDTKAVAKAIDRLFRKAGLSRRGKPVYVSLAGACAVIRLTGLPNAGPTAVREHIQEEIRRYAVFSGERTVSDFVVCGSEDEAEETKVACLTAAKEESADALVEALMNARIDPAAVDVAPLATARALHRGIHAPDPQGVAIFTVVEPGSVHHMVFRRGNLSFCHTAHESIDIEGDPDAAERLGYSVNAVLDHYEAEIGTLDEVGRIVIATEDALSPERQAGIREILEGQEVAFGSRESVALDTGLDAGGIADLPSLGAVGLALRAFEGTRFPVELNLVPLAAVLVQEFKKRLTAVALVAAALFLLALIGAAGTHVWQGMVEEDLAAIEKKIAGVSFSPELAQARDEVARLEKRLLGEREFLASVGPEVAWSVLLKRIAKITPKDVRLTCLEEDGDGDMVIQGESRSVDSVYRFAGPFRESGQVGSAKLSNLSEIDNYGEPMVGFSMDCELTYGAPEGSDRP